MNLQKISVANIIIVSMFTLPLKIMANDGKPAIHWHTTFNGSILNRADTLPAQKKTGEAVENSGSDEVIKIVPKARKQSIPIPIGVQVKPIILIKPKIIKPIIKILH